MRPDRGRGRLTLRVVLAIATFLLALMPPDRAEAQTITASKILCDTATCTPATYTGPGLQTVSPGVAVFYRIRIQNVGTAGAANLASNLPAGFHLTASECGPPGGPFTPVQPVNGTISNLPLAAANTVDCRLHGYFDGSSTQAASTTSISNASNGIPLFSLLSSTANVDLQAPLPTDLAVTKTIVDPLPDSSGAYVLDLSAGPRIVTYRITIENRSARDLYLGRFLQLNDRLSLLPSSVSLYARFVGATCKIEPFNPQLAGTSDCLAATPSQLIAGGAMTIASTALQDFAAWRYPANGNGSDGLLRAGDKMVLDVQVEISALHMCMNVAGADGILETANIELAVPAPAGGQPTALAEAPTASNPQPANNNTKSIPLKVITGATQVNPNCYPVPVEDPPALQIIKTRMTPYPASGVFPWGSVVEYRLQFRNVSPTVRIRNIHFSDVVRQGVGTASMSAVYVSHNCLPWVCAAGPAIPQQQLTGYGDMREIFTGVAAQIAAVPITPGNFWSMTIRIRYTSNGCDSLVGDGTNRVDNLLRVLGWEEVDANGQVRQVGDTLEAEAPTNMASQITCPMQVIKAVRGGPPSPRIQFGVPITYDVTFSNTSTKNMSMGTLIDTLRFAAAPAGVGPYAIRLPVDYSYSCSPAPGSTVSNYPPSGSGAVFVLASQLAQQGVRIIQNTTPVAFGGSSSLVCQVTVTVHPPDAPGDPYCSTAALENSAIIDSSRFYNSNQWPGDPTHWGHVSDQLPDCYNWVVSKGVTPGAATWTWQGGGPLSWTYTVTNLGPPMGASIANIRDWFTWGPTTIQNPSTPLAVSVTGGSIECNGGACTSAPTVIVNPTTSNPAGVSVLDPFNFGTRDTLSVRIDVAQAPASVGPGNLICNNVQGSLLTPPLPNAYWKNDQTLTAQSCIPVLATAPLRIRKQIINPYGVTVPNSFEVSVTCEHPLTPSTYQIAVTGLTGATTIQHVAVGDHCTVAETPPPALQPRPGCAFPVWETSNLPPGPVTIVANTTNQVTVTNRVRCLPVGTLVIRKNTVFPAGSTAFSSVMVNVSCSPNGPARQVSVNSSPQLPTGQVTVNDIPVGSICTVTEELPPDTSHDCGWAVFRSPAAPVTIPASGMVHVNLSNRWICTPGGLGLRIVKRTRVGGQPVATLPSLLPFFPWPAFPVTVTCGAGVRHVTLNSAGHYAAVVGPIPSGTICTVEEQPPPFLWGLQTVDDCTWAPFYAPGQQILYVSGQMMVDILNRQYCHGDFPL